MGKYHFGFVKALYESDLMPRIIAGSSVGGMIAAGICGHGYGELWKIFDADYGLMTGFNIRHIYKTYSEGIDLLRAGKPVLCTETLKSAIYTWV